MGDVMLRSPRGYSETDVGIVGEAKCARYPVSNEVTNELHKLAGRAEELAEIVKRRLSPIVLECPPIPKTKECEIQKDREYPPLFQDMRDATVAISNWLDIIADIIERAEV